MLSFSREPTLKRFLVAATFVLSLSGCLGGNDPDTSPALSASDLAAVYVGHVEDGMAAGKGGDHAAAYAAFLRAEDVAPSERMLARAKTLQAFPCCERVAPPRPSPPQRSRSGCISATAKNLVHR